MYGLEDAAALGVIFNKSYWNGDVEAGFKVYEQIRKLRVTKVQDAADSASKNTHERIGKTCPLLAPAKKSADFFGQGVSSNTDNKLYAVCDESKKLTIEEMNRYTAFPLKHKSNCSPVVSYGMYAGGEGKLGRRQA